MILNISKNSVLYVPNVVSKMAVIKCLINLGSFSLLPTFAWNNKLIVRKLSIYKFREYVCQFYCTYSYPTANFIKRSIFFHEPYKVFLNFLQWEWLDSSSGVFGTIIITSQKLQILKVRIMKSIRLHMHKRLFGYTSWNSKDIESQFSVYVWSIFKLPSSYKWQ